MTNDSYTQFDFLSCSIRERGVSRYFYLCVVYRPTPSTKKGNNKADRTKTFHGEWASYLEHLGTTPSELLVVGDINIHLDVSSDASTVKFVSLLEVLNLELHVNVPTHRNGHTLDIVLSRKNSRLIHNKPK